MILNAGIGTVVDLISVKFTKVAVGTGSSPVTGSETALTNQLAKNVISVTDLGGGYVQFNAELAAGDPAMLIQEMGLVADDGTLCYRQVVTAQNKVAGVTYSINYKIRVQ